MTIEVRERPYLDYVDTYVADCGNYNSPKGNPMVFKSHPPRSERDWLMPSEAAKDLEISPKTLTVWAIKGRIPYIKTLGGHRRYLESDVEHLASKIAEEKANELR